MLCCTVRGKDLDEHVDKHLSCVSRWEEDICALEEGVRSLFVNDFARAESIFLQGFHRPYPDVLRLGEHNLRAEFAFNWALAAMIRGIASLEKSQFQICLDRISEATKAVKEAPDSDWIGHQIIHGCCLALAGVIFLLQHSFARGAYSLAQSWTMLRKAEQYCQDGTTNPSTRDADAVVRSVSLFVCGVVGLIISLLPSSAAGLASFVLGITVSRDMAISRLERCWCERGLLAPWSCAVALAYHVDLKFFLGEDSTSDEIRRCVSMVTWALDKHQGSIVFGLLKANCVAADASSDPLPLIESCEKHVSEAPALGIVVHAQHAKFAAIGFQWRVAASDLEKAASMNVDVGRRSLVPTLRFASALCHLQSGNEAAANIQFAKVCQYANLPKTHWQPSDKQAFRKANAYMDGAMPARRSIMSLLDILELFELKFHTLRRMSASHLQHFYDVLVAAESETWAPIEGRRLRYIGELARLLRHHIGDVTVHLYRAQQALSEVKDSTSVDEVTKDGTEALIQYSFAEVYLSQHDFARSSASCAAMQSCAWRAEFWVSLVFKAHCLAQRVHRERQNRCEGGVPRCWSSQTMANSADECSGKYYQEAGALLRVCCLRSDTFSIFSMSIIFCLFFGIAFRGIFYSITFTL